MFAFSRGGVEVREAHGFTNEAYDILRVLAGEEPTVPIPDFEDAYQTQRVLEASMIVAEEKRPVNMDEVK